MNATINIPVHKSTTKDIQASSQPESASYAKVLITKFKARTEAKTIVKSLKEVKDFESGKKQPKSFEDFLKEL